MRRDVFQAIADPTRREILHMVATQPLNVNAVGEHFDVTRAAIYKHVKILVECGLIEMKQKGRERYCEAKLGALSEVAAWVEQYRQLWDARFDSLDNYLNELQSENKSKAKKQSHARKK